MAKTAPPPTIRRSRLWGWGVIVGLAVLLAGAAVVYRFNPSEHGFYPRCMLYVTTGWQCPGCGSLRAAHALLHGEWEAAFRLNPLLLVLLPMLAYLATAEISRQFFGKELPAVFRRPVCIWTLVAIIVTFAIARNLPFGPFAWLNM